ncbi:uncharacterized protein ppp1r3ab [Pholidichthys leucotaenia]
MEFVGQPRPSGACNLLGVLGLSSLDVDDDEDEVVIGIRPKSSPLPRRKSSVSDEDSEPEPPPCGSRRVSFADAKGLCLVQVKEFDTWDVPKLPGYDSSEGSGKDAEEFILSPLNFHLALPTEELLAKVSEQKVEMETTQLLPGTTVLKGVVRVLNISFSKAVYVRTTLDNWSSHFDLLAEYIPGSSDGVTDSFSFKLPLVPPFGDHRARVDFCVRYETPVGTFWCNNDGKNYTLFCHRRAEAKEGQQKENLESRMSSSRKSQRKAARMARVQDFFAQRDQGMNGTERDESPPEIKQAAQKETLVEKPANVQSFSEGNTKPEGAQIVSEPLETWQPPPNVAHDISPEHDHTSNSVPEKCESLTLAVSATWTGGESATESPDNPLHSIEPSPALQQHANKDSSPNPEINSEYTSNREAVNCNISIIQTDSYTFGTVVAPLYHQVFDREGSESQSMCNWGNPTSQHVSGHDIGETGQQSSSSGEDTNTCNCVELEKDHDKNGDFCLAEKKNWEMMVEEEENDILNEEESESVALKQETFVEENTILGVKGDKDFEDMGRKNEEEIRESVTGKYKVDAEIVMTEKTTLEEELAEKTEIQKTDRSGERELQAERHFERVPEFSFEKTNIREKEEIERDDTVKIDLNNKGEASVGWESEIEIKEGNGGEQHQVRVAMVNPDGCMEIEDMEDELECLEERSDITRSNTDDSLSALVHSGQEGINGSASDEENTREVQHAETHPYKEGVFQSSDNVTHHRLRAENDPPTADGNILTDEPEVDQSSGDSASAESDSDEEAELYMRCLRAVRTGAQSHKHRSSTSGSSVSKRPSISRTKPLSTSMPSISESLDEEQHLSHLEEAHQDTNTAVVGVQLSERENINQNVSWWKDTCCNISKILLFATIFVVFLVVAYHYDFLACLVLYLMTVVWLFCQVERPQVKDDSKIG